MRVKQDEKRIPIEKKVCKVLPISGRSLHRKVEFLYIPWGFDFFSVYLLISHGKFYLAYRHDSCYSKHRIGLTFIDWAESEVCLIHQFGFMCSVEINGRNLKLEDCPHRVP